MMKELEKLTRKELCCELYKYYLLEGTTPIGRKKPLTLKEFIHRYLNGIGACRGFKKDALIGLLERKIERWGA